MTVIKRVVKPTTRKGKKALLKREPKLVENAKQTLFIRGRRTNELVMNCMRDMYALKKPDAVMLGKKNDIVPFENATPIEQFAKKFNASLFVFGCSSKKRPNDIILGRTYHNQLLDMIELGIEKYKSIKDFACEKIAAGIKPCLVFSGEAFDSKPELMRLKNLLVDLFQREQITGIRLQGVEHLIQFIAFEDTIFCRNYRIFLKKSGTEVPRVELEEIGPSVDFKVRRSKLASDDLFKTSCKRPKELKVKKVKNISKNVFGTKEGRIHIRKQNIASLQVKRMKGLKRNRPAKKARTEETASAAAAV